MSEKLNFLLNKYPGLLRQLDPETKAVWGKMNVQQMIEHMSDSIREANGKTPRKLITTPERLPAMREFILSEKEFRPNTKNSMMAEEPEPIRNASMQEAIAELENEIKNFQSYYSNDSGIKIMNPFFGSLNFDEWTHLLHKHAKHHLKQFGVTFDS